MKRKANLDKTVFRKTKDSRWCIKTHERRNGRFETYAHHSRCQRANEDNHPEYNQEWSWLIGDTPDKPGSKARCHECGTFVPAYILTLVRLHEGL